MRGLEIRLNYANGVVAASIFGEEATQAEGVLASLDAAYALGRAEYQWGVSYNDAPVMFNGVESLISAWEKGMADADEVAALIQSSAEVEEY